jgi:DNA replicative helicase MCM subunit Mcm2 (Cdc46/Mcm family)
MFLIVLVITVIGSAIAYLLYDIFILTNVKLKNYICPTCDHTLEVEYISYVNKTKTLKCCHCGNDFEIKLEEEK